MNIRPRLGLAALAVAGTLTLAGCTPGTTPTPTSRGSSPPTMAPTVAPGQGTSLQQNFVEVVKTITPSVVQISTGQGLGSGIIFDAKGDIVTNAHVVENASSYTVTFSDGKTQSADLVGAFIPDDLAVIHVSGTTPPPARFADSSKLVVGDIVMAVGNPLGLQSSVSEGIVSAVGRTVSEGVNASGQPVVLPSVIQTSAAINPGNSGGALVDLTASVVGIPTLAAVDQQLGGSAPGIGFAIPSNTVKDIASQLIDNNGRVINTHRAELGVQLYSGFAFVRGAIIVRVTAGGPAAKAGIVPGDVVTAIDGKPVQSNDDLSTALAADQPGQQVKLSIAHADGTTSTVSVTLGQLPAS